MGVNPTDNYSNRINLQHIKRTSLALSYLNTYAPPSRTSHKAAQNQIISDNIMRKSLQLSSELEILRQRDATKNTGSSLLSTTSLFANNASEDAQIKSAIDSILKIRQSLGITKPAGKTDGLDTLSSMAQSRGNLLSIKS